MLPASTLKEGFIPDWFIPHPRAGILLRTVEPVRYPALTPNVQLATRVLDAAALCATIALALIAVLLLRRMRPMPLQAGVVLFVGLMAAATDPDFWNTPYGYARPIAPLFILLAAGAAGLKYKRLVPVVAVLLALLDLRIFAEMEKQAFGVLHFIAGGGA